MFEKVWWFSVIASESYPKKVQHAITFMAVIDVDVLMGIEVMGFFVKILMSVKMA